jgi:hypothetical protein
MTDWTDARQRVERETQAKISRWYREGVELASSGNSLPADDGTPHLWRSRGYQWFHANMRAGFHYSDDCICRTCQDIRRLHAGHATPSANCLLCQAMLKLT